MSIFKSAPSISNNPLAFYPLPPSWALRNIARRSNDRKGWVLTVKKYLTYRNKLITFTLPSWWVFQIFPQNIWGKPFLCYL